MLLKDLLAYLLTRYKLLTTWQSLALFIFLESFITRPSLGGRIKCYIVSVCLSVSPSVHSVPRLWFTRNRKARETTNLVETHNHGHK